jgi:hypothetical protein
MRQTAGRQSGAMYRLRTVSGRALRSTLMRRL